MSFIFTLIYFILALDIIVVVHELGHLLTAKKFGVYCYEFSIGMGPKLFTFHRDKTGTVYNFRAIPIGGYVQMAGEETATDEEKGEEFESLKPEQLIGNKPPWQRLIVFVAGVVMNFILALLIMIIIGVSNGFNVQEDYFTVPSESGLSEVIEYDDYYIDSVDGTPTSSTQESLLLISKAYEEDGNDFSTTLEISDVDSNDSTTIELDSIDDLQIASYTDKGISAAFTQTGNLFSQIVDTLRLLFNGSAGVSDLSGPVGIFTVSGEVLAGGFFSALYFIAFLSINIGFVNLLPIPALDGGRILFTLIEIIFRKPVSKKVEDKLIVITFMLLIGLMIYVTFNDILRIFQGVL